jgi:hypothetical protein
MIRWVLYSLIGNRITNMIILIILEVCHLLNRRVAKDWVTRWRSTHWLRNYLASTWVEIQFHAVLVFLLEALVLRLRFHLVPSKLDLNYY